MLLQRHVMLTRAAVVAVTVILSLSPGRLAAGGGSPLWSSPLSATNTVVSSPTSGGGYPENPPVEGGCVGPSANNFNANHSESELAVEPGSEQIVGSSKFFFDKFSTGYNFYLGSYNINGGNHSDNIIQGYDCSTTETTPGVLNQKMPPSWTNTTDPNVGFDTKGRVYQTMLPFNAFWTNLHPDGAITVSFSDDLGAHWVTGNGGQALEQVPNSSSFQFGHVEDKQWIAVNHYPGNRFQDHVYATWDVINGNVGSTVKLRMAVSRDRGLTFGPAATIVSASSDQMRNQFSQPGVDPSGDLYVAYANIGVKTNLNDFFVTKSSDDGKTFSAPVLAGSGTSIGVASGRVTNTTFRDGIPFAFAVSQDFPGHLYLAYNDFNGTQYNVFLVESTDGGQTWSKPVAGRTRVDPTSASTYRFSPTRTLEPAQRRLGPTSARRTSRGIRSSPASWSTRMARPLTSKHWEGLGRWPAPATTTHAGSRSSATTSGLPYRAATSTCSRSRPTTRRTSKRTTARSSTTSSRCSERSAGRAQGCSGGR